MACLSLVLSFFTFISSILYFLSVCNHSVLWFLCCLFQREDVHLSLLTGQQLVHSVSLWKGSGLHIIMLSWITKFIQCFSSLWNKVFFTHTEDSGLTLQNLVQLIISTGATKYQYLTSKSGALAVFNRVKVKRLSLLYQFPCIYLHFPLRVHVDLADEINKALQLFSGFTGRSVSWDEQAVVMVYTLIICSYSSLCGSAVFFLKTSYHSKTKPCMFQP